MEYFAYSLLDSAYAEATRDTEFSLPEFKLKLNWNKNFKSAWLTFASIGALLAILAQAQSASAAYYGPRSDYYVRTNGNCLHVRTGPSRYYASVACYRNGSRLPRIVGYRNGFARLSNNYYVGANWINTRPGTGYTSGPGVGGISILSVGSRGSAVARLQRILGVTPTGYYGYTTANTVRNYQARNGLRVDGVAGPQTLAAVGF
ncbi:peptidoglycan-binding domain-containing protein [Mastigocladopsis repens]|uniref:peptidoglycan-binding domain-containing protein n=1 Tax=Mastigocladopsis repens TaxID=221287 RepID=UPI00031E5FA5|nr:peptidoglycan-binding domain-containing protein [Mastigocladopsis repens]